MELREEYKMDLKIPDDKFNEEELKNTPKRWENFMKEWLNESNDFQFTLFDNEEQYDQLIITDEISFYSLCSHHIVPFFGTVHIGYIPSEKIAGLSKFGRVVDKFSHRPQIQERLTQQIKKFLVKKLEPHWLMVVLKAEHLCMSMRGTKKPGHNTITSAIYENSQSKLCFDDTKLEFLTLINLKGD
jgi:GTP cyclohydrolase I